MLSLRRRGGMLSCMVEALRGGCAHAPRKRLTACLLLLAATLFAITMFSGISSRLPREELMEQRLAEMQLHVDFLDSLYRARQEDLLALQAKVHAARGNDTPLQVADGGTGFTVPPELEHVFKNISGSRTLTGLEPHSLQPLRLPFVYQLLPHLMNDAHSLRPAFHLRSSRTFSEVVVGIPTVKRDKESYLTMTLMHLIEGLTPDDVNSTLIVVFIGETDLEYVINTAYQIESLFPKEVKSGLVEVISPSSSYYPDFETLAPTLGDSAKRAKWRTKQNLDTIFLMAYAQMKGTFYLMLEDDVIAKKNYMQSIKQFTASTTVSNPSWFFIEFCQFGGIGKLFRCSDVIHFITYVQLFYTNMPIDWLLESYLADKVCTIDKTSKQCGQSKLKVRPKYKTSLFQHIGLYSSLKGKIQKVEANHLNSVPTFYPHENPILESIRTDIEEHSDYTLKRAYEGETFFWGVKPKKGDVIEFWFETPVPIERYTFRSGNAKHKADKLYEAVVEALPASPHANFTQVGAFDEFGLADGGVKELGPLSAIRIRLTKDNSYWAILSEIELVTPEADSG